MTLWIFMDHHHETVATDQNKTKNPRQMRFFQYHLLAILRSLKLTKKGMVRFFCKIYFQILTFGFGKGYISFNIIPPKTDNLHPKKAHVFPKRKTHPPKAPSVGFQSLVFGGGHRFIPPNPLPLDPKTMKNEGFTPPIFGL